MTNYSLLPIPVLKPNEIITPVGSSQTSHLLSFHPRNHEQISLDAYRYTCYHWLTKISCDDPTTYRAAGPSAEANVKCRFCQKDNREEARYCSYCGQGLDQTCPGCGAHHPSVARFCDKCGRQLDTSTFSTQDPEQEGERKLVSVLFADTAGFTSIAEMLDPEEVTQIMQDCLAVLTREIERYGGTVTQFTGDGIMALFGAPNAHEDHAKRACHAGIAIRSAVVSFSERILDRYGTVFRMRIGINSGVVVVGSLESGSGTEYTALGDTINIASRIESLAPPGTVCCSGDTFSLARDFFLFEEMGSTKVKGKVRPVELYKVLDAGHIETRMGAAIARGLTPFVGRQQELQDLLLSFDGVAGGTGRAVSIVGEAGMGKSRLLLEFGRALQEREFTLLVGECLPFGASIAYLPLLALLRSYFGLKEGSDPSDAELCIRSILGTREHDPSPLLSPLFDLLSIPWKDEQYEMLEPRQRRDRIFHSLSQILIRESEARPLIIAIESLMWIDRTSEEFLGYLAELLHGSRILLILLYRPDYSYPWSDKTSFTRLNIDHLPTDDTPELISALLDAPPSHELQNLLMTTSGGNPLFMEELANSLFEKGYVNKTTNGYVLNMRSLDMPIPATIHGIIAARIDHLPERIKRTLQFAAVIGKHFSSSILGLVLGNEPALAGMLQELQNMDLIYKDAGEAHNEYRFKHDLVQEVAYNSLLLRRRKEIHGAVAQSIESCNTDSIEQNLELLAYHFSKSANSHKAYLYLRQSGDKSTNNSSLWEAFRFYKQALALASANNLTSQEEGLEIRLNMASAMISLGFPEDSLDILRQAEAISRNMSDTKSLTSICSMIGLYYSVRGDTRRGIRYAEECLKAAEQTGDVDLIAPIVFDLCSNYAARGEFGRVVEIAPMALSLLRETGKKDESFSRGYNIYSAILAFYAFSLGFKGEFPRAAILFKEGLTLAQDLDNLYSMGLNEILYGYIFCQKGDGEAALAHFEHSIHYLERGQIFVLLGLAWNGVGRARYFLGDLQQALIYAEKGLKVHTDAGATYNLSAHFWFIALINYELGNLEEARKALDESFRLARKHHESYYIALSKMLSGRIYLEAGAITPSEAERVITQATRMLANQGVQPQVAIGYLLLAEMAFHMGQVKKVDRNLRKALILFKQMGMVHWAAKGERLATAANLSTEKA